MKIYIHFDLLKESLGAMGFLLFCGFGLCVGHYVVTRKFRRLSALDRLVAGACVFGWFLSVMGGILLALGLFRLEAGGAILFIFLPLVRLGFQDFWTDVESVFRRAVVICCFRRMRIFCALFIGFAIFLLSRSLFLPLLGWDTFTYHGVKTGLWVQQGGWFDLLAPGGWEAYRTFLAGGELWTAWAMLFTHSDLLVGLVDVGTWLWFGLSLYVLGDVMGICRRWRVYFLVCVLCSPALARMVGSGYVDTIGAAWLFMGFFWLFRAGKQQNARAVLLGCGCWGMAASVKVNLMALLVICAPAFFGYLVHKRLFNLRSVALWTFALAMPVIPWLAYNYWLTGFILGSTPLEIFGYPLGEAPENLNWFLDRPDLHPYRLKDEALSLFKMLKPVGPVFVFSLLGILLWVKRPRVLTGEQVLLLVCMTGNLLLYMAPSFSVIRLSFGPINARFLFPVLFLGFYLGAGRFRNFVPGVQKGLEWGFMLNLLACFSVFYLKYLHHMPPREWLQFAAFLFYVCGIRVFLKCTKNRRGMIGGCLLLLTLGAAGLSMEKNAFRSTAYAKSFLLHDYPRYWVNGLEEIQGEPPLRIAFTYGSLQTSHRGAIAPFLGERLQHELFYIPPDAGGMRFSHAPEMPLLHKESDFPIWYSRLVQQQIDLLLCLKTASVELKWAENHPDLFLRLQGDTGVWGLFELK